MKQGIVKKIFSKRLFIFGMCFLFICVSITPAMGTFSSDNRTVSTYNKYSLKTSEGDIPTWYQGDEWIYSIDPLYYSSPNGSFSGTIENFKQKVVGITDSMYEIEITGDINGDLTMNDFSGYLTGDITGTSHIRISDLAEDTTELHSQGAITIFPIPIPIPYEMNLITSSSPLLEVYDFPLNIGEQWQLVCMNTISGLFTIEGLYDQSLNGSQIIDDTVQCTQKEQISVPAGTVDCYKIGRSSTQSWYSTDIGNMVKSTIDQSGENTTLQIVIILQSFSHANQPITVSEDIFPSMTTPGASVVLSGQAILTSSGDPVQNGDISIEIPSAGDSWITTTNSAGQYSITIVAPTMSDDTPSGRETGSGGVVVQCSSGRLSGYRVQTLTTLQDNPPAAPSIKGQTEGKPKVSYSYTVVTEDPESDKVFYYIDWGDGTNSSWLGPYLSNENVTLNHIFAEKGSYTIKAQARDIYHAISGWGTLQVTMPTAASAFLPKLFHWFPLIRNLLQQFFEQ